MRRFLINAALNRKLNPSLNTLYNGMTSNYCGLKVSTGTTKQPISDPLTTRMPTCRIW